MYLLIRIFEALLRLNDLQLSGAACADAFDFWWTAVEQATFDEPQSPTAKWVCQTIRAARMKHSLHSVFLVTLIEFEEHRDGFARVDCNIGRDVYPLSNR